jgi:mono/diheme cytochrome c family protein
MKVKPTEAFALTIGAAAALILAGATALLLSQPAAANMAFAKQTGKSCADCHVSGKGGALTPFGEQFKANGNKLPK